MTGPLTFTKMPYPLLPQDCDGVYAFSEMSRVAKINFDLLSASRVGASGFYTYRAALSASGYFYPGHPSGWERANFLADSVVTVPDKCLALLMTFTGTVAAFGAGGSAGFAMLPSGPGLTPAAINECPGERLRLYVNSGIYGGCRQHLFVANQLVAGADITWLAWWHASFVGGQVYVRDPGLELIALVGAT